MPIVLASQPFHHYIQFMNMCSFYNMYPERMVGDDK